MICTDTNDYVNVYSTLKKKKKKKTFCDKDDSDLKLHISQIFQVQQKI